MAMRLRSAKEVVVPVTDDHPQEQSLVSETKLSSETFFEVPPSPHAPPKWFLTAVTFGTVNRVDPTTAKAGTMVPTQSALPVHLRVTVLTHLAVKMFICPRSAASVVVAKQNGDVERLPGKSELIGLSSI
jgi:hypothetical protein